MLGNRTIQVDMVKKTKPHAESGQLDMAFEDKLVMVSVATERAIKRIGLVVCAYVILDTARKVVIELAKSAQPQA